MGVLCPPNSSVRYRDRPHSQQIGGYPRTDQLSSVIDEVTLDSEGRCVILEFPAFVLLGVYSPANRDQSRDDFRLGFLEALDARVRNLVAEGKQVVLTGDLNVISSEKDTCNLAERLRKEGLTIADFFASPSRRLFNHLIYEGRNLGELDSGRDPLLSDLCRRFHPAREGMFTCWDTKKNTRPANNGSRIDYVLCSSGITDWFVDANIQEGLAGSDHCPVFAVISDTVVRSGGDAHILDVMNPEGMFRDGRRQRQWSNKDLLPLSARLIPDFDRRRTIKDMFAKKAARPAADSVSSGPQDTATPIDPAMTASDSIAKRPAASATLSTPSPKKSKMSTTQAPINAKTGPAQSSLKAFFQSRALETSLEPAKVTSLATVSGTKVANPNADTREDVIKDPPSGRLSTITSGLRGGAIGEEFQAEGSDRVFDPVEAKESWSKLLGGRISPNCEHGEACIRLVTKKPGINYGRSFFICPRPLGPSGEKERGTEWRCGTFVWSSDWNGSRGQSER
ncbi:related to APN2 - AP endonuclease, exonuclease III homolog [Cephalotrichum gorgonifer]|uniref:DNA-(apurinic or apyrimidinic site) endonuclease 2 n=1 Tax=Cephalotrichum gorgonifer TaxID=2041049 RepID=A0AAE8MZX7_9PEZI|nr:related to APN2 - AP endonuclease, exonuclease III homolog [Cephalotrichum gorgonifer]